jgi:hypothetical protein
LAGFRIPVYILPNAFDHASEFGRDSHLSLFPPNKAREQLPVVTLMLPIVTKAIEQRCRSASEKCGSLYHLYQPKHGISFKEAKEVVNARNMDVIEDEQGSFAKMRINVIV